MADMNSKSKKLSINLSLFNSAETPLKSSLKSPKNFEEPNGVVGLGILAAMNTNGNDEYCSQDPFFKRASILANSPRSLSNPIPILGNNMSTSFSATRDKSTGDVKKRINVEEMELCEEYTCVICHIGDNQIKKREYFYNAGILGSNTNSVITGSETIDVQSNNIGQWVNSGVVSASSLVSMSHAGQAPSFPASDFLNSCFLCGKELHGLDIFMYRGEKGFCSSECRGKQISMDERKEKSVSGTMKPLDYSASPFSSSPMQFFAGVAAA